MNTANKLTLIRVAMVPIVMLFLLMAGIPNRYLWALLFFVAASLTDCFDGHIARKRNQVTDFGKFLDPLADKMLVTAVLICLVSEGLISAVAVVLIIMREFMITSLRLVASGSGKVIAANIWGKIKTVLQMVAIICILLCEQLIDWQVFYDTSWQLPLYEALIWIAAVASVISAITYLSQNIQYINTTK